MCKILINSVWKLAISTCSWLAFRFELILSWSSGLSFWDSLVAAGSVEILKVLWHLFNLGVVMILDLSDELGVIWKDEVDSNSLSSESTSSTDSVDVVLLFEWELVVDDETNLLDINTSCEKISGDEHSGGTSSELLHDAVSLDLVHLSVHGWDGEVMVVHGLFKLENSLFGVAINKSLVDIQVGVEIKENLHLPLFFLDGNVVLTDTLKSKIFRLDKNLLWISHEMFGQSQNVVGHGGGEQSDLNVTWQEFEDLLDLLLESSWEHLISLVHDKKSEVVCFEEVLLHHIVDSSWCSNNDVDASLLEKVDVIFDRGSSDAGVDLHSHVLSDGVHNESDLEGQLSSWGHNQCLDVVGGSVNNLQRRNCECSGFTSTRLSLYDMKLDI